MTPLPANKARPAQLAQHPRNLPRPGVAPPPYRPQQLLQAKPRVFSPQAASRPSAPPVYRPQHLLAQPQLSTPRNPSRGAPAPYRPSPALQPKLHAARATLSPRPASIQRVQLPAASVAKRVIQRTRRRVQNPNFNVWWWNDTLAANWHGHAIPVHPCHTTHVGQDQLVGGWTVIDHNGVFQQSGVYGPYEPGVGKHNHVERQLISDIENGLETAMGDDNTFSDTALAVIEVHQWVTPCSGAHGCTTYLDNQVIAFNGIYAEVAAGARLSATFKYNGGISETHPSHPKQVATNVTTFPDNAPVPFAPQTIVHNNPTQWW
jgi:hypothetical protein